MGHTETGDTDELVMKKPELTISVRKGKRARQMPKRTMLHPRLEMPKPLINRAVLVPKVTSLPSLHPTRSQKASDTIFLNQRKELFISDMVVTIRSGHSNSTEELGANKRSTYTQI